MTSAHLYSFGVKAPVVLASCRRSLYKDKKMDNNDSKRFAIGYGYQLSKRTELYAAVARLSQRRQGRAQAGSSSLSPTPGVGNSLTGYEIGLRHNF